jgi:hypothetical protein
MNFLIILLFIAYYTTQYQLFSISTYGFSGVDLFLLIIYILFLKEALLDNKEFKIKWKPHLTFFFIIIIASILSGFYPVISGNANFTGQYFKSCIHFIFLLFFPAMMSFYPVKMITWTRIVQIWLIIGIIINVFGVYQIFARAYDLPLAWIDYTNISIVSRDAEAIETYRQLALKFEDFYRATSIFSEPSALATFNLYLIVFIAAPYAQMKRMFFSSRIMNIILIVTTILGLFFTFSLTGLLGAFVIISLIIIIELNKRVIKIMSYVGAAFLIIILADVIVEPYINISVRDLFSDRISGIYGYSSGKSETIEGESFFGRASNASVSVSITQISPLTGVGIGNFGNTTQNKAVGFSEFSFLSAFAETGFLGGVSYCLYFLFLFFTTGRYLYRKKDYLILDSNESRLAGITFYLMIIQIIINFVTGNNFISFWSWLPLAMIHSIINTVELKASDSHHKISFISFRVNDIYRKYLSNTRHVKG